ncbi:hypothetical protein [Streptomyces sp. NPDC096311]|uniref:hypothetical protein n=1 Tax=Streptomyces sp. NPDC096311 TaxID=3366083 RepID=UPI0038137E19
MVDGDDPGPSGAARVGEVLGGQAPVERAGRLGQLVVGHGGGDRRQDGEAQRAADPLGGVEQCGGDAGVLVGDATEHAHGRDQQAGTGDQARREVRDQLGADARGHPQAEARRDGVERGEHARADERQGGITARPGAVLEEAQRHHRVGGAGLEAQEGGQEYGRGGEGGR